MTFLEAINAVLRRLREDTVVSSNSTDYSKLIGDFVNQSINECERSWNWSALLEDCWISTVIGTRQYYITDNNTDIVREYTIITAHNFTKKWPLRRIRPEKQINDVVATNLSGSPTEYNMAGVYNQDGLRVTLNPNPDANGELMAFNVIRYTDEYNTDGSDDTEVIQIPPLPVVLTAYSKAVAERGEDGGIGISESTVAARMALADSIGIDASSKTISELSWHPV